MHRRARAERAIRSQRSVGSRIISALGRMHRIHAREMYSSDKLIGSQRRSVRFIPTPRTANTQAMQTSVEPNRPSLRSGFASVDKGG